MEQEICRYDVTGRLYNSNKRFVKRFTGDKKGYMTAMMINLWNGSVWEVDWNGKRKCIKRVTN